MKVAIFGANSHIAKNLFYFFSRDEQYELFLFARNTEAVRRFVASINSSFTQNILSFDRFSAEKYDVIINCVGIADPCKVQAAGVELFLTTERFDNIIMEYLKIYKDVLYINLSSGAVYGTAFKKGITKESYTTIDVNNIRSVDFYRIAKLNSEAKHRSMTDCCIIDLRVFGFFSRFIDLESGFLLCEMIRCVIQNRVFVTNSIDIARDYIAPSDLFSLIELCITNKNTNNVLDVYSAKPVRKSELIDLYVQEFGLEVKVDIVDPLSVTGTKLEYYSCNKDFARAIGYTPLITSVDNIERETLSLLRNIGFGLKKS